MSGYDRGMDHKKYRVFIIYDSGHVTLMESSCTLERAHQIKTALTGIFPEIRIEEMPPDFGPEKTLASNN